MFSELKTLPKTAILIISLLFAESTRAQDGTIYPLNTPAEPNAILLGTGGVENQPASETWFRQWGDPMACNITTATLTPFFPKPGKANGATIIVAPGGGFRWLSMGNAYAYGAPACTSNTKSGRSQNRCAGLGRAA